MVKGGKGTVREHLEQVEKSSGKTPHQLDVEPLPFEMHHIWETYCDLRESQVPDSPIAFSELKAYSELTGVFLTGFEIKCVKKLDAEFMRLKHG